MRVQIIKKFIKKNIVLISLLLLFVFVLWNGIVGVDFGHHWDEHLFTTAVTRTLKTGVPLPKMYTYPSLCYHFALITLLPDFIHAKLNKDVSKDKFESLIAFSQSYSFSLRLRIIFFIISSLSLFWVYGLVLIWRKSRSEALLSAALLGLSWEFIYHARFAMTDAITMQFGALTIFCLFLYLKSKSAKFLLRLAAVMAGLTFGSKYHGIAIIIPVILAIYLYPKNTKKIGSLFYESFIVLLFFISTYLITTPGTILDPFKFLTYVWSTGIQNKEIGLWGYSTSSQLEYLLLIMRYFSFAVFSKYSIISSIFFSMSLVGLIVMFKEEKKTAILFIIFPIALLTYMSSLKVMIVRNFLILFPFFTILASRGCLYLYTKIKHRSLPRLLFSLFIALLLLINASWLVKSTLSIKNRKTTNYINRLVTFVDKHPSTQFLISERITGELETFDNKKRPNVVLEHSKGVKAAIFYSSEIDDWRKFLANRHDYTWTWFGPYEINYNYYPTWVPAWGVNDRIVVMPINYFNIMDVFAGPDEVMLYKEWDKLNKSIFK